MTNYYNNFHGTTVFTFDSYQVGMNQNVSESVTVPGTNDDRYKAIFSYNATANVFVGLNNDASPPGLGNSQLENSFELRPAERIVNGADVLYFITPDTSAYASVGFWKLP